MKSEISLFVKLYIANGAVFHSETRAADSRKFEHRRGNLSLVVFRRRDRLRAFLSYGEKILIGFSYSCGASKEQELGATRNFFSEETKHAFYRRIAKDFQSV